MSPTTNKSSTEGCSPGVMAALIPDTADLLRAARESSSRDAGAGGKSGQTWQVWRDGGGYFGVPASSDKTGQTDLGGKEATGYAPYLLFGPYLCSFCPI